MKELNIKRISAVFAYMFFQIRVFASEITTEVIKEVSETGTPYLSEELRSTLNQNVHETNIFGVILSLIIVLGLIYATSYLYQKLIKINSKITKTDIIEGKNEFKILSGATLGQGKFLHAVEVNDTYLILGSTANNISLLKEFSKKDIRAEMPKDQELHGKN